MRIGFSDAVIRFGLIGHRDSIRAYNSLFEALNWAVALDDRIGEHWAPDGSELKWGWRERLGLGAEIIGAVRFARNRVHHQWSDAIYPLAESERDGIAWAWPEPADDLPSGRPDPNGEAAYREHLEGRPVWSCLAALDGVFHMMEGLLEPHQIRKAWAGVDHPFQASEQAGSR
jgi:hypothetical protein